MKPIFINDRSVDHTELFQQISCLVKRKTFWEAHIQDDVIQGSYCRLVNRNNSQDGEIHINISFIHKVINSEFIDLCRRGFVADGQQRFEVFTEDLNLHSGFACAGPEMILEVDHLYEALLNAATEELAQVKIFQKSGMSVQTTHQIKAKVQCFKALLLGDFTSTDTYTDIAQRYGYQSSNLCTQYQYFVKKLMARLKDKRVFDSNMQQRMERLLVKKEALSGWLQDMATLLQQHRLAEHH